MAQLALTQDEMGLYETGRLEGVTIPPHDFWWWCPDCHAFHPGLHGVHNACDKAEVDEIEDLDA